MPLIDIQTDLKSLTYGEFGAEKPLITKDINSNPSPNGIHLEGTKRVDDLLRITKLLTTTGAGLKYASNSAMLNTVEQSILTKNKGKSAAGVLLRGLGGTAKQLASTLAQVPVNGTGLHFVEGFSGKLGYLKGVQGHIEYKNNRRQDGTIKTQGVIETSGEFEVNNSNLVLEYFSKERKADGSTVSRENITTEELNKGTFPRVNSGSFDNRKAENYISGSDSATLTNSKGLVLNGASETDFGVGFNTSNDGGAFDIITAKAPFTSSIADAETVYGTDGENLFEDLMKFRFKIISPSLVENGEPLVTHLTFRAFLDSFDDQYSAQWNDTRYIGRAENFHTYSGFDRTINFSFKVAALSAAELQPMYDKLNLLAGSLAPTYVGSSYMRGNFIAITIGDYLVNQTGFLSSIGLSWNTDYPVGSEKVTEGNGQGSSELFHILDVNCSFTPIHKFNTTFGSKFINDTESVLISTNITQNENNEQV